MFLPHSISQQVEHLQCHPKISIAALISSRLPASQWDAIDSVVHAIVLPPSSYTPSTTSPSLEFNGSIAGVNLQCTTSSPAIYSEP
jgi:hypothetical protein